MNPMNSYNSSIETLKTLVAIYNNHLRTKKTYQEKGVPSPIIDRELIKIKNQIKFITGVGTIESATLAIKENEHAKK